MRGNSIKKLIIGFALLGLSTASFANHFTICDFQGAAARNVVNYKLQGQGIEEIQAIFITWYFTTVQSGAISEDHRDTIMSWLERIESEENGLAIWMNYVYSTYTDPDAADEIEKGLCVKEQH